MENVVKSFSTAVSVLTFFLVCQTTLADIFESVHDPKAKSYGNRVCTNGECTMIAANMLNYRNEKINPCNDFANYVCGNYELFVPKKDPMLNQANRMYKKLEQLLKAPTSAEDKPYHKLAKAFYTECRNEAAIRSTMKTDILALLDEIGGWPLLNSQWQKFNEPWEVYLANIHRKFGIPILFKITVDENMKANNDGTYVLSLEPTDALAFGERELIAAATALGADASTVSQDVKKIFELERKRIGLFKDGAVIDTLKVLKSELPNFDIENYVKHLIDGTAKVTPDTTVMLFLAQFFLQIHELTNDKRLLANYVGSVLVLNRLNLVDIAKNPEVEGGCVVLATMLFDAPLTQMYVKKHFTDNDVVLKVSEMTKLMAEVLNELIKQASWMNENTRNAAFKKLAELKVYIAHPEAAIDDKYLSELYNTDPHEQSEGFIALFSRIERVLRHARLSTVGKLPNYQKLWPSELLILQANAFYRMIANKAFIHIGLLETPFFTQNVPEYVNYAAIGQVLAHELSHGFDNDGKQYDEHGNFVNWWSEENGKQYDKKTECYVNQYDKEGVNGGVTLAENIADNVGMRITFEAYKKLIASRGGVPEPALPGFEEFTSWCDVSKPFIDPDDTHSPDAVRIRGVVQNMKEFGKEFECSKKAAMNPTEKCSIW